jgi:hypothetical protein
MKNSKYAVLVIIITFFFSCSNNGDDPVATPLGYINVVYNNSPLVLPSFKAERDGDYFRILASRSVNDVFINSDFAMLFHKDGTMIKTTIYDATIQNEFTTSFYYSRDTFTFNIENIDEVNLTIKVNFTGKIFSHDHSFIDVPFKTVSGSIFLPYNNIVPPTNSFAKNETTMLVNNTPWRGKGQLFNDEFDTGSAIEIVGDTKYSINIVVPLASSITLGTFNFSQNSDIYKLKTVNLFRYYPGEISPNEFVCTGSLTIAEKALGVIKGTFNLTAHDPLTNENVTITNGVYSARY